MWRPETWLANRKLNSGLWVSHPHLSGELWSAYEAGATAMLEALRARGYHVDRDAVFCSRGERQTLYNLGNTGTYTFIPDEEAQQ